MPDAECLGTMMRRLRSMSDDDYLRYLIAYQAAPTLGGIKPATLICPSGSGRNLFPSWQRERDGLAAVLDLRLTALRETPDSLMILAFRPCLVERALADREALGILGDAGYDVSERRLDALLGTLCEKCRSQRIPHEVGLFLGYPPGDVRAFIRTGGRGSKATGCWKAYANVASAMRFYRRCRLAKLEAARLIGRGARFEEIVSHLLAGVRQDLAEAV